MTGSTTDLGRVQALMSPSDVAQFAGVSVQTLAVWRMKAVGPRYIKAGKQIRYRVEDLNAWLETQAHGG